MTEHDHKRTFLKKYKLWLIIGASILLLAVVLVTIFSILSAYCDDYFQIAILIVSFATLIIFFATLIILCRQTTIQNHLAKSQIVRDRFEMYWQTYDPITDEQVRELQMYPEDYMTRSLYETKYESNDEAIRMYIYMSQLYEYLGFSFMLEEKEVPYPVGHHKFLKKWARALAASKEFQDVRRSHDEYYPALAQFLCSLTDQSTACANGGQGL